MIPAPPYLTDAELAEICRPLVQGAARIRFLRSLGVKVSRRGDGTPLVWRSDFDRPQAPATIPASNEPAWTRQRA
jgi:hypothetical protein